MSLWHSDIIIAERHPETEHYVVLLQPTKMA